MRYAILASLALLVGCASLPTGPTQTATLTVVVLADDTVSPAPGVRVTLNGAEEKRTDARGMAAWVVETPGSYRVVAEGAGWRYEMGGDVSRDTRWTAIAGR